MSSKIVSGKNVKGYLKGLQLQKGFAFGLILLTALIAFEVFNYSTTDYALTSLLGDLRFLGLSWATILAIAFCGIDFAGIARLFSPEEDPLGMSGVWYLFGAWMLAAAMNAILTWWGVSLAIWNHQGLAGLVVSRETLLRVVPIFVAVLVWLIRVLIIGTFSTTGNRLFSYNKPHSTAGNRRSMPARSQTNAVQAQEYSAPRGSSFSNSGAVKNFRPAPKPIDQPGAGIKQPDEVYANHLNFESQTDGVYPTRH